LAKNSGAKRSRRVDPVDVKILATLRDDGRATVQALAATVGLGSATASVRLQTLRNERFVQGIHARINYPALGYVLCAYVLLQMKDPTGQRGSLSERLLALPEVEELAWVTGDHDVILKVWAKETRHLEAIVVHINEIGARSKTLVVLGEPHIKPGVQFEAPITALD
jgi:DNA-binding Lrp family transcriptional regulator